MSHPLFVFVLIPRLLLLPYYCWDHHSSTASTTLTSRSAGRFWLWGWAAQSASLSIMISTHFNDRSADGWLQLVHPWINMLWWCAGRLREVRGSCSSLIWIWIVPFWNSGQIIEFWISADSGRDFELAFSVVGVGVPKFKNTSNRPFPTPISVNKITLPYSIQPDPPWYLKNISQISKSQISKKANEGSSSPQSTRKWKQVSSGMFPTDERTCLVRYWKLQIQMCLWNRYCELQRNIERAFRPTSYQEAYT